MKIALVGNSNVGKSELFNRLTGLNQHVGNWPGKTIEVNFGNHADISIIDLPGIYSLSVYTEEEKIAKEFLEKERPDAIINVVDASVLERNLFLTTQISDLGIPMVIALNMVDVAKTKGMEIDIEKISRELGIKIIPIAANRGENLDQLIEAARNAKAPPRRKAAAAGKRYERIGRIMENSIVYRKDRSLNPDRILLNRYAGYAVLGIVSLAMFLLIFTFGDWLSLQLIALAGSMKESIFGIVGEGIAGKIIVDGFLEGILAGTAIAIPYLVPFYIILAILEDSGYLARMAFLMDSAMQKMGMHGKAFIPMILAYGCNVPACLSCRILETRGDRLLSALVVTLVPCAAVTVVVMGLVATYVSPLWAFSLYMLNLAVIFIIGRVAFKVLPGEKSGLIMEMPSYKMPNPKSVLLEAWRRIRSFVRIAFPIIIGSTVLIPILDIAGVLDGINRLLEPITVGWLGWPAEIGLILVFGILRKELVIIMLAGLLGSEQFGLVLSDTQMITIAIVTMFYVPCISTIAVLKKEHGWDKAIAISLFEIVLALLLGGIAFRLLGG